ncbi:MAG: DUF551 domain-containing protein [Lachnospiraceae bacterium]|nr:DUF551 domain-containing protein [Lachnospiraceae bacterium]
MSISEQVKELRESIRTYENACIYNPSVLIRQISEAAGTIEALSEKLANMERSEDCSVWIMCKDRLPEDGVDVLVWYEYFRYGEYNRLFQTTGISFTHNGKWSGFVNGESGWNQLSIIAWQLLPEPYHEP